MKLWLVILAVAVGIVLGIAAFTAQGPPSAPSVTSPTALTPATSQTFTFTMTSNVYSLQPPNSIDLPDPEEILANETYKLSKRGDVNYLVLLSVVDAVANKLTDERVISAWKVLSDVATQGGEDVGIVAATRMGRLTGPHLITAVKDYLMSYKTVLAMVSKSVTAKTRTPK